jgi:VWFA-related protein
VACGLFRTAQFVCASGLLVVCVFTATWSASAQQEQPAATGTADQSAPLRVTTRLVEINVIVDDKHGDPIIGLTKADFLVFDNKKPQEIQFFSAQDSRAPEEPAPLLSPNTYTNRASYTGSATVILVDALNTEFADQALAKKQIVKFLQQIRPHDRVALYWLGSGLHVLHNFTTDASVLRDTLATFSAESSRSLADSKVEEPSLNNPNTSAPGGQTSSRDAFRRAFSQRAANESASERVRQTVAALIVIAHQVSSLKGRKNLVWVSGSFPFSLGNEKFDLNWRNDTGANFAGEIERAARALTDANIAVYPVDARGLIGDEIRSTEDSSDAHPEFASEGDEHLPSRVAPGNVDTMKSLAARTGGQAFYGTNDLSGSIRRAIDDSRATYTLAYSPAGITWDGAFHAIKVKVKTPGADVRTRTGYFAIPDSSRTPGKAVQAIISQTALSQVDATGIGLRVLLDPPKTSGSRSLIVHIQLDLHDVHMRADKGHWTGVIQSVFEQLDRQGGIIHADDETFNLNLTPSIYEQTLRSGVNESEQIQVLPAAAQLCVVLRDPWNDNLGSVTIPLVVYFPETAKP